MIKWIALFVTVLGAGLSAADVVIAEKGQAKAEIVIPAQPKTSVKFAAEELKHYLDKITGGDFRITSQPTAAVKIRLGQSPEAEAAGLKPETLKRDGFFISATGNDIFIVGVDNPVATKANLFHLFYDEQQRATLLGVYEFLEQLGVRWPAPGPDHELVPTCATLKVPEGLRKAEPFFRDRQLPNFWDFMKVFPDAKAYSSNVNDIYLWGLRMKLSGRDMVPGCHTERSLKLEELWGKESEQAALINGKRNPNYSCWTDPAVAALWKKAADSYFSGKGPADAGLPHLKPYLHSLWPNPFISEDEFMIDPMDHYAGCDGRCRCQRCNEFREKFPCEDDSELLWAMIADVAASIKAKHPGKFITTLVYPPKMKLPTHVKIPDNVRVRVCIHGPGVMPTPNRMKSELDLVRSWSNALGGNKPPLWTYQCEATHNRRLAGVPETYPHLVGEFLKLCRNDIAGMYFQQMAPSQTYRNLDAYITARLLWDPDRSVDEEMADYFKSYYGPAAEPAQKLFKRFEDNWITFWKLATPDKPQSELIGLGTPSKELQQLVWSKVYTPEEMRQIDAMVAAVEKAAAVNPVYAKRAALLRPWLLDIMKAERSEVMDKAERRQNLIVRAPVVTAEPTPADWAAAPVYQMISAARLKPQLAAAGQFKLLRIGDTLRLRAELKEPNMADSLTKKDRKSGDTNIWKDNDVEIFLYASDTKDLWHIIVNDQGNWASQKIKTGVSTWKQLEKFQVKVLPSADGWLLEAAIPLDELGTGELRFNLTRNRQIKGQPNELSTWSPLAKVGGWHDPDNYGALLFGGN